MQSLKRPTPSTPSELPPTPSQTTPLVSSPARKRNRVYTTPILIEDDEDDKENIITLISSMNNLMSPPSHVTTSPVITDKQIKRILFENADKTDATEGIITVNDTTIPMAMLKCSAEIVQSLSTTFSQPSSSQWLAFMPGNDSDKCPLKQCLGLSTNGAIAEKLDRTYCSIESHDTFNTLTISLTGAALLNYKKHCGLEINNKTSRSIQLFPVDSFTLGSLAKVTRKMRQSCDRVLGTERVCKCTINIQEASLNLKSNSRPRLIVSKAHVQSM